MKGNKNLGTFPSHATIWRNQFISASPPESTGIYHYFIFFNQFPFFLSNINKKTTDTNRRALAKKREKRGEVAAVHVTDAIKRSSQFVLLLGIPSHLPREILTRVTHATCIISSVIGSNRSINSPSMAPNSLP